MSDSAGVKDVTAEKPAETKEAVELTAGDRQKVVTPEYMFFEAPGNGPS